MSDKKQKEDQVVIINDVEYKESDFSKEETVLVNHVADLDRKIGQGMFNIDQMQGGRSYHMEKLEVLLAKKAEEDKDTDSELDK